MAASSKMGKSMLDKIKKKSTIGDKTRMNLSKAMDRSGMMERSRNLDRSKNNLLDNSPLKTMEKREDSKTLNFKKVSDKKVSSSESSQSSTEKYQI